MRGALASLASLVPARGPRRLLAGIAAIIVLVALTSGVVRLLGVAIPDESLSALYLLAAIPIGLVWGRTYAIAVAAVGAIAFELLFIPEPLEPFQREAFWVGLAAYLVIAAVLGELAASRARLVQAADAARRKVQRDLHDGAQQHLVALTLRLRTVEEEEVPPDLPEARNELADIATGFETVMEELRRISQGLHPQLLSDSGLPPALRALARRSAVPVDLEVRIPERPSEPVELAAYYVVSETLANAAKHAGATRVRVEVAAAGRRLRIVVADDGVGGADAAGSGLAGLNDPPRQPQRPPRGHQPTRRRDDGAGRASHGLSAARTGASPRGRALSPRSSCR